MKHVIPHGLDPALARRVADAAFRSYVAEFEKYKPVLTWRDEQTAEVAFSARGVAIKGTFTLVPGAIEMEMEVPFVFNLFKNQAVKAVEDQVQHWVRLAREGKLDDGNRNA